MGDREIREPDHSTVDDWFGQNVAEDQEVADRAVEEAGGDMGEAERRFETEAEGQKKYEAGHPRPDGDDDHDDEARDTTGRVLEHYEGSIPPRGQPGEEDIDDLAKAPGEGGTY